MTVIFVQENGEGPGVRLRKRRAQQVTRWNATAIDCLVFGFGLIAVIAIIAIIASIASK